MHRVLDHSELKSQLTAYILAIVSSFTTKGAAAISLGTDAKETATAVFRIITGRNYSHLSRRKAEKYRDAAIRHIKQDVISGEPATFFYDLGPGYHASLRPGRTDLSFDVGLSEIFALYQISEFRREVSETYSKGARFFLVIDNLCALSTNDIPVEKTARYCRSLRELIQETGTQGFIQVLVESELFDQSDYPRLKYPFSAANNQFISEEQVENVARFIGRRCDMAEALARIDIYAKASEVTESNLARIVTGVRLTQRATENTLGFRSFPGGDSRIQAGQVAITHNKKGKLCPILMTSKNVGEYDLYRFELPTGLVPESLQHLTYVRPVRH